MTATTKQQNKVLDTISKNEPITHDELCDQLSYEWDELQEIIRELRQNNQVRITLDRQYTTETK